MNRKKDNSNRGAALLSVIIVMSVVVILATLILSVAYTNFSMKVVDKKSKDNFYTAEKVLDEVCAGIQEEISEQYKAAYTAVMENYGIYDSAAEMREDFQTTFVLNMVNVLKSGSDDTFYDAEKLGTYVKDSYAAGSVRTVSCEAGKNKLDTLEDGLSLRNVKVTYQEGSYVDSIATDIKIIIPEVEFSLISNMPEIAEYSLIAQGGLVVEGGAHWKVNGKAYVGLQKDSAENTAVLLRAGSALDASDADTAQFVSEGDVKLIAGSSFQTGSATSFWAKSVTAVPSTSSSTGNNEIRLMGRSYIEDDVTLNGTQNTLLLGGQYYGYSNNDADASQSSAIIINGQESTLDFSKLDTLILAGSSFVATAGETYASLGSSAGEGLNTKDVLMGDSIAVKSNQLVYMVPTVCEGIVSNPMSYTDYRNLIVDEYWEQKALATVIPGMNKSLSTYGNVGITPVFTNKSGGTVYLYLEFTDSDIASQYFMDYYKNSEEGAKIQSYLQRYLSAVQFRTDASFGNLGLNRLVTQGNYLVPAAFDGNKWSVTYEGNTGDVANIAQETANYASSFKALCTKLVTNMSSITSDESGKTVYSNIVDEEKVRSFFDAYKNNSTKSNNVQFDSTGTIAVVRALNAEADDVVCAVVVDNANGDSYKITPETQHGILIATGDVTITPSAEVAWNGLILCNGKITLQGGSSSAHKILRSDPDAVGKAMQLICCIGDTEVVDGNAGNYAVMNFFKGGGNFTVGSSSGAEDAKVDVRECITFENWKAE